MTKLAIDVALLPPDEVMDICIEINRAPNALSFFKLNKQDSIPHISLAMGVIDEEQLPIVNQKVNKIAVDFPPIELEFTKVEFGLTPEKEKTFHFCLNVTEALQNLHERLMNSLLPIFSYKVSNDNFFLDKNEKVDNVSLYWVKTYANESSFANFDPHVSLRCSFAEYNKMPIKFTADKMAVGQLGNFGALRKIFFETSLKK
ncbi:MAG: hypothetical protein ABIB97_06200 [Patescibacteria group bacterium]